MGRMPDFDGDGYCNPGDCIPFDDTVHAEPKPATDLAFSREAGLP